MRWIFSPQNKGKGTREPVRVTDGDSVKVMVVVQEDSRSEGHANISGSFVPSRSRSRPVQCAPDASGSGLVEDLGRPASGPGRGLMALFGDPRAFFRSLWRGANLQQQRTAYFTPGAYAATGLKAVRLSSPELCRYLSRKMKTAKPPLGLLAEPCGDLPLPPATAQT